MPYLNPKLTTVTVSASRSSEPKLRAMRAVSWWTLRLLVSMTRSASPRRSAMTCALPGQAVEQPAAGLERVRAPGRLLAADQHVVVGLEEHQGRGAGPATPLADDLAQAAEERAGPDVDDDGDVLAVAVALVDHPDDVGDQRGRQVVDDEEAEVLELLGGRAAAGAGHAGDDDERVRRRARVLRHSALLDLAGRRC